MKLRVAVLGVGYLGSIHARLWVQNSRACLSCVYDIDSQRAAQLAGELGVQVAPTMEAALDQCDAVTIAVPTRDHADVALRALAAGKHVLLEKPVAATIEQARSIAEAARNAGVIVHIGHVERYNAAFVAAQQYITTPLFIEAHRLSPFRVRGTDISVIGDLMIHDLDLVLSLIRQPIVRLEAHGVAVISDSIDIANVRIEFASGCVANLTASRLTPQPLRKLRLFQPTAYISLDFSTPELEVYRLVESKESPIEMLVTAQSMHHDRAIVYEHPQLLPINAIEQEHYAFVASILDGVPAIVSLDDGIAALELAWRIERLIDERMAMLRQR